MWMIVLGTDEGASAELVADVGWYGLLETDTSIIVVRVDGVFERNLM